MESAKRAATHAANRARITATARDLLARDGASGLSLREVAREMGQTSSALYRYFTNRDELLTALIIDAYNDLGAAVEAAESVVARADRRERWRVSGFAARAWAKGHPHEYGLIFGTPVPGYVAPEATIAAASRITKVLATIVDDAYDGQGPTPDSVVERALEWPMVATVMPNVPAPVTARAIIAWTQLFGAISFELFGHYDGVVRDLDLMFALTIDEMAAFVGLPASSRHASIESVDS